MKLFLEQQESLGSFHGTEEGKISLRTDFYTGQNFLFFFPFFDFLVKNPKNSWKSFSK